MTSELHTTASHHFRNNLQEPRKTKLQRSSSGCVKQPKPSLEIYRPPSKAPFKEMNGPKVHFEPHLKTDGAPTKGLIKRSKSFTGSDLTDPANMGFDMAQFGGTHKRSIQRALTDPSQLELSQMMELVRLFCNKAIESLNNGQHIAQICSTITKKDGEKVFVHCLISACREWFVERERLRDPVNHHWSRQFLAYVQFIMELYLKLKSLAQSIADTFLHLLYECCLLILAPSEVSHLSEVECLRTVLLSAGRRMELDSPDKMEKLIETMRLCFLIPELSPQVRKIILELIELRASSWSFNHKQTIYYYPYTTK